eukprot:m.78736 g.78736  ORF g.78736 m.78736 type:complete len:1520 (+) comp12687_c0_seq3:365-4924(+)
MRVLLIVKLFCLVVNTVGTISYVYNSPKCIAIDSEFTMEGNNNKDPLNYGPDGTVFVTEQYACGSDEKLLCTCCTDYETGLVTVDCAGIIFKNSTAEMFNSLLLQNELSEIDIRMEALSATRNNIASMDIFYLQEVKTDFIMNLDLSQNLLRSIKIDSGWAKMLSVLNLQDNLIETVEKINSDMLQYLDLSDNKLTIIDESTFKEATALLSLDLSRNALSSPSSLEGFLDEGMDSLIRLNLNGNGLEIFKGVGLSFRNLVNLRELYLGDNNINMLINDMFPHSIEEIQLFRNKLKLLPKNMFHAQLYPYLTKLSFFGNNIDEIGPGALQVFKNIEVVSEARLSMGGNPSKCWISVPLHFEETAEGTNQGTSIAACDCAPGFTSLSDPLTCVPILCGSTAPVIKQGVYDSSDCMGQKPAGTQCEVKCKHTPEWIQFQCGFDGLWVPLSNPTCSVSLVLDPIIVDEPYRLALPTGGTVKKETVQARVDDGQSRRSLDSNGTVATPSSCFNVSYSIQQETTPDNKTIFFFEMSVESLDLPSAAACDLMMEVKYSGGLPVAVEFEMDTGGLTEYITIKLDIFRARFSSFNREDFVISATQFGKAVKISTPRVFPFAAVPVLIRYQADPETPLPIGITVDPFTGMIEGIPQVFGHFSSLILARDEFSGTNQTTANVTLFISEALTPDENVEIGTLGETFVGPRRTFKGGRPPLRFFAFDKESFQNGSTDIFQLPAGLTLVRATGQLLGKPSTTGSWELLFQVVDANNASALLPSTRLRIVDPLIVTWFTETLPKGVLNREYSFSVPESNTNLPEFNSSIRYSADSLPAGLILSEQGDVSGSPTSSGVYDVSIFASNLETGGRALVNNVTFSLEVNDCDETTCMNGGICIDTVLYDNYFDCNCSGTGFEKSDTYLCTAIPEKNTTMLPGFNDDDADDETEDPAASSSKDDNTTMYIILGAVIGVVLCFSIVGVIFLRKRMSANFAKKTLEMQEQQQLEQVFSFPVPDEWELSLNDLEIKEELGGGQFGVVYNGTYYSPVESDDSNYGARPITLAANPAFDPDPVYDFATPKKGELKADASKDESHNKASSLDATAGNATKEDHIHRKSTAWSKPEKDYSNLVDLKRQPICVAIKQLRADKYELSAQEKRGFLEEAECLKPFNHVNVVKLIGVISQSEPLMIVLEYLPNGDLHNYVKEARQSGLQSATVLKWCAEATQGLHYLSEMHFVHRDFAARNLLLSQNLSIKITDFGMSRLLTYNDYYRKDGKGMMPVRWMAIECLSDGVFTVLSDLWSLGIVFWEMYTFGQMVYPGLSNIEVYDAVSKGYRLEKPEHCPEALFRVMNHCWSEYPSCRPLHPAILSVIEGLQKEEEGCDSRLLKYNGTCYTENLESTTAMPVFGHDDLNTQMDENGYAQPATFDVRSQPKLVEDANGYAVPESNSSKAQNNYTTPGVADDEVELYSPKSRRSDVSTSSSYDPQSSTKHTPISQFKTTETTQPQAGEVLYVPGPDGNETVPTKSLLYSQPNK